MRAHAGAFRLDLYQRLGGVVIELPPLRDRPDDVVPIAAYLAAQCQRMLTAKELANILAISPKTIYGYVERNMIPHYKIEASVRFRARDVVEWLRRHSCTRSDTVAQTLRSAPGSRMRKSA